MITGGRDKGDKHCRSLIRVGSAISHAVERFASVGEAIGDDNPEIKIDMYDACKDAKTAGCILEQLCDLTTDSNNYNVRFYSDRSALARSARALLSSVTRVLLIADTVVVKQLLTGKDRVSISLNRLENVANFTEFVKAYSMFGSEMVELAHVVSDRSNTAKDERRRAEMGSARRFLERSTMMLLTSAKACLRHPDCESAKENRDTVFIEMRRAMDSIHSVIKDSVLPQLALSAFNLDSCGPPGRSHGRSSHGHISRYSSSNRSTPDWMMDNDDEPLTAFNAIKRFEELVELSRVTLCKGPFRERLICAFDAFIELTQDFTDSAYTRHENREKILLLCDRTRLELNQLLRLGICLDEAGSTNPTGDMEETILQTLRSIDDIKLQLRNTALEQADELFRLTDEFDIINQLRSTFLTGDPERLNDYVKIFSDHCDHVGEVCRLLHNVTTSETLQIYSKITENHVNVFSPQILNACFTLCAHPNSRIAKDNLEVFLDFWITLYSDVHQYSKDTRDCSTGVDLSGSYANYPENYSQPGSVRWSGTPNSKGAQQIQQAQQSVQHQVSSQSQQTVQQQQTVIVGPNGSNLDPNDPSSGGHGKIPGSVDLETGEPDKNWVANNAVEDNDIVRRAKAMSQMALNMNQFTRGEGDLKTTQDLFTQAEFLAEEANKFYKLVRHFSYQVPSGIPKKDLLDNLDKVPTFVQQLQFTVKQSTVGKAATFTKVDNAIKETKNLMTFVCRTVDSCIMCASKYNIDMGAARARSRTLSPSGRYGEDDGGYEGMSSGMGSKGGTASSDPNI